MEVDVRLQKDGGGSCEYRMAVGHKIRCRPVDTDTDSDDMGIEDTVQTSALGDITIDKGKL